MATDFTLRMKPPSSVAGISPSPHAVDSVATDPPPRDSGRVSFRWVRGGLIGEGTCGKVYIALNATTGEMMAVKQVDKSHGPGDESNPHQLTTLEALKNEIEVLKGLSHPNIVEYLGLEEVSHFLNAFYEYVPGGSLSSCLQKYGCFNEDTIQSFTRNILHGVEYLHSEGIVHGALRADHILVAARSCKISGFGRSKCVVDANTLASGPIYWLAPEEINSSKNEYESKIDIWGVGCIVVEMWTGARPWNGQDLAAVLFHLHTKKSPPVPAEVALSFLAEDFRQKCFISAPEERPTAAELLTHPYIELQENQTPTEFDSIKGDSD